jgi:hypothetical protein
MLNYQRVINQNLDQLGCNEHFCRYPSQNVSDLKPGRLHDFALGDLGNPPRQYIVITGESKGDMSLDLYFLIGDFLSQSWWAAVSMVENIFRQSPQADPDLQVVDCRRSAILMHTIDIHLTLNRCRSLNIRCAPTLKFWTRDINYCI